jgi:hypothetical protein
VHTCTSSILFLPAEENSPLVVCVQPGLRAPGPSRGRPWPRRQPGPFTEGPPFRLSSVDRHPFFCGHGGITPRAIARLHKRGSGGHAHHHQSLGRGVSADAGTALQELQAQHPTDVIIETGTYLGTGSTRILAEFFSNCPVKRFVTLEANCNYWRVARNNLRRFPFVEPLWGLSVGKQKALNFIRADEAIREHYRYPDFFIDDTKDPVGFYTREVEGAHAAGTTPALKAALKASLERGSKIFFWQGEDLLPQTLELHRRQRPLIVLDSAGGIGNLEFRTVLASMEDASYALLLDDTHHLKHFRSLRHIQSDPKFRLIGAGEDGSWALAVHNL